MTEIILVQANAWGFRCECAISGNLQILPPQKTERWKLLLIEDRWVLLVGDVPQIHLHPQEVVGFLERRRSSQEALDAV